MFKQPHNPQHTIRKPQTPKEPPAKMADPKKPQKSGRSSNRNANDASPNPADPKLKSRDKYKSDVPLQSNQSQMGTLHTAISLRIEGEWFQLPEKVMKGLGILRPPEEDTHNGKPHELDETSTPDLKDEDFEDMEQQMTQEEIDNAYSEYMKDQQRQDEEMDEATISNLKSKMWMITKELKNRRNTPSWKRMGFFKNWLNSIMELTDNIDPKKPAEPTIAYLVETNTYLTRKLNELETKATPSLQPQPHDLCMHATPMTANEPKSWANVAATPPKPNQSINPKQPRSTPTCETPKEPTADPHCLIIQVHPPILAEECPNGIEVRKKINEMLDKKEVPQFFHVMAVGYLRVGNIKITTTHTSKASDLMNHSTDIANIIMKNKILLILPDTEHYCIKINKVLTWCGSNEPMSIDLIHEEMCTYLPGYKDMKQWCVTCWLGNEETIHAKNFVSIVLDLTNKQDRDNLLGIMHLKLFKHDCTITPYEERPQVFQCTKCGLYSH